MSILMKSLILQVNYCGIIGLTFNEPSYLNGNTRKVQPWTGQKKTISVLLCLNSEFYF